MPTDSKLGWALARVIQQPDNKLASKRGSVHPTFLRRQLADLSLALLKSQLFRAINPVLRAAPVRIDCRLLDRSSGFWRALNLAVGTGEQQSYV